MEIKLVKHIGSMQQELYSILVVCNKNFIKIYNLNPSKSTSGNLSKETILNTTKYAPKSLYKDIHHSAIYNNETVHTPI